MEYAIPLQAPVAVPVAGTSQFFPVRRIYCVGRNYVEHAKEMGHSGREAPFFFMKPADALLVVPAGATGEMAYPGMTSDLHHEIELVVAIGKAGRNIAAADANSHIWGYAVGLDMTRRDLQGESKKLGRPWDTGKGFDQSAPIAPLHPVTQTGLIEKGNIRLDVNGAPRTSFLFQVLHHDCSGRRRVETQIVLMPRNGAPFHSGEPESVLDAKMLRELQTLCLIV